MMAEQMTHRYRRILLQIDAATHCRDTIGTAMDIAARLNGEVKGVFIQDRNLAVAGTLGFVREIRLSSPAGHSLETLTVEAQLRAMARSVQRQLEREAVRRKMTVGFRAISSDAQTEEEEIRDADLVIVESTGRLHSRNFRGHLTTRLSLIGLVRPTLFLKGSKRLAPEVAVVCDTPDAAERGVVAATNLLSRAPEHIALVPFNLNAQEQRELSGIAENINKDLAGDAPKNVCEVQSVVTDGRGLVENLAPVECIVVITVGGPFLGDPMNLEPLFVSRHPLLCIQ
ncbi:universal stress protein [Sneathiella sp.]|uniref:universal stress protein n=1 Tax=Sneathiella sp. TaxID=1964365 RepID=UPI0025FE697C|nr:universal stress protein [Sneathiella sp.]